MNRGLGIDLGAKRVGLAIGSLIAQKYDTIPYESYERLKDSLTKIIAKEEIKFVVIGVPEYEHQSRSKEFILNTIEKLKSDLTVSVKTVDETLSTFEAERILKEAGKNPQQIKQNNDSLAAQIILQQYIDEND